MRRFGMKARYKNQYKWELLKACLVYRLQDNAFEEKLNEVNNVNANLMKNAFNAPLDELTKDPIEMSVEEFKVYYENLRKKYGGRTDSVSILKGALLEEPTEEIKDKESNAYDEGYRSIDRMLKAQAKEEKKVLEECEEVAKEHLQELYKSASDKIDSPKLNK